MQQVDEYVLKAFFVDSSPDDVVRFVNSEVHFDFVAVKGYCQVLLDGTMGDLTPRQRDRLEKVLASIGRIESFVRAALDVETARHDWYAPFTAAALAEREVA